MKVILRFLVVNRKAFKIAWYLQASCPKHQAPRINTEASKGCAVMAERASTIDKLTTSIFGIVLNDLRWKNAAIIKEFASTDKIVNRTTIIDSNVAFAGDRYGRSKPSAVLSILKLFVAFFVRSWDLQNRDFLYELFPRFVVMQVTTLVHLSLRASH